MEELLVPLLLDDADLVVEILLHLVDLFLLDLFCTLVLRNALARKDLDVDDRPLDARGGHQGGIPDLSRLFPEDGPQELLFRRQLGLPLRGHLADQHRPRTHLGADPDDPAFVKIAQAGVAYVRDVARDLLRSQLGVPGFDFQLLDVNGRVAVFLDQLFAHQDGVLEVVPAPGHERNQHVASQGEFALVRTRAVGQHLPPGNDIPPAYQGGLVDAGVLVGAFELGQRVDIHPRVPRRGFAPVAHPIDSDDDAGGIDAVDHARALADHDGPGVLGRDIFHPGADVGSFGPDQGNGLALHVGPHQRAVGVVIFQERDQAGGHAHQLLGGDVDIIHPLALHEHEIPLVAGVDPLPDQHPVVADLGVRLGDVVLLGFPRGLVEGIGLPLGRALPRRFQPAVLLVHGFLFHLLAHLEVGVPREHDLHEIEHLAVLDLPVGGFDEPVLVDPGVAAERGDQPDIGAFRRFDRADAAVMGRVHVAHFEPGTLAAQPARPQGGQAPLVGDLRKGVGLVHELGQLAAAEKLPDRGHHRLGVDQVVRHRRGHFLVDRHLLLDRAFHAHEPDAELVFEQFPHGAHPAVSEVVDIVNRPDAAGELQRVVDHGVEVLRLQRALLERRVEPQLDVELQPSDLGEIVLAGIVKHPLEQGRRGLDRRRVARALLPVDLDEGVPLRLDGILAQGLGDDLSGVFVLRVEHLK